MVVGLVVVAVALEVMEEGVMEHHALASEAASVEVVAGAMRHIEVRTYQVLH